MLIVLNNKCNLTLDEFIKYQDSLKKITSHNELVLCPSNIYLTNFNLMNFNLGSQNVSSYKTGAFTGEASAKQLKSLGVKYSIVGHSERRNYQRETNTDINKKIDMLINHDITPILCVGETKEDKETNNTMNIIKKELHEGLDDIDSSKVIIAYEPIWAIGTGITPTTKEVESVITQIKQILPQNKVIYGGSVNNDNIDNFKHSKVIDGYLLGGLSLKPNDLEEFISKLD